MLWIPSRDQGLFFIYYLPLIKPPQLLYDKAGDWIIKRYAN